MQYQPIFRGGRGGCGGRGGFAGLCGLVGAVALAACGFGSGHAAHDGGSSPLDAGASDAGGGTPDGGSAPDGAGGPDGGGPVCRLDVDAAALSGSWDPRFTIPGFLGPDGHAPTVYDFARDLDGSIVAVGEFRYLGGARVDPMLRLRNGKWEPARATWELTPPGSGFSAIAIAPDGALALATYDDFGARAGQIWLDDGSGLRVIGEFDGLVRRLRWYKGQLWVAGWHQFRQAGSVIQGLAVWNGKSWTPPHGGRLDGFAFELIEDSGVLLVGGDFTTIGGIASRGVAAWTGKAWRAVSFPRGAAVYALARGPGNALYAGGAFGDLGAGAGGLARWTGTTWVQAGGGVVNRAFPGVVTDLVQHAGSLFASGCFFTAGGVEGAPGAVISRDVARFDGAWHSLDDSTRGELAPWLEPRACGDEGPSSVWDVSKQALFSDGKRLLLGGSFPGIAGTLSQAMIAHDGSTWLPEGDTTGIGIGGSLDQVGIAASSCTLWGAGQFSHLAGAPVRARVARFTGDGWAAVADDIPRDASCPGFAVAPGGEVALACTVFPIEGDPVGQVYRVDGDHLAPIGGALPPVQAIAFDAAGGLWAAGGAATGYLARLDGDHFVTVEDRFDAPVALIDAGGAAGGATDVLVAGSFTAVGDTAALHVARYDGAAWHALGGGVPGFVTAIARGGGTTYASSVDDGGGAAPLLLGAFDGAAWRELAKPGSGLTPQTFFNFNAIRPIGGGVIAVGSAVLDDGVGRGALVYRGGAFTALGGGVHAIGLSGLAVSRGAIWVGGLIAEAGSGAATTPTLGVARYVLAP
jgi:hypothetical protein